MENAKIIIHDNEKYAVFIVEYKKEIELPAIIDYNDFKKISKLNKHWRFNENGFVVCSHTNKSGITRDVFLHDVIMLLNYGDKCGKKILHINRIGLDNRTENLMYDDKNKCISRNIKKKKRTVTLPKNCGIIPDDIPTYVWYEGENEHHGARFIIKIDDAKFVSTSTRDVALKDKLNEAKMFLEDLFKRRPDLKADHCMNGVHNTLGKDLAESYYKIAHKAGFEGVEHGIENTIDLED